jgi:hypothetical protein
MNTTGPELVIALFDVLGFEERIRTFSLEQVHGQYKDLLAIASSKGSHAFFDARPASDGTFVPYLGQITVEQDYFSDTILLWTRLSAGTLGPFLRLCSSFVCETLKAGLPMRGALTVGAAIMDKTTRTYLGQPLVEAARVEKAQEWIGVSFGPSFWNRRDIPYNPELVRLYTKHRKPGYSELVPGLVVDWPRKWRKENNDSAVPVLERLSRRSKVPEYYRRTIEFVRDSDGNPNWFRSAGPDQSRAKERA